MFHRKKMARLREKLIPSSLSELINPEHTALLIIDVQNDFCTKGGVFDRHGSDLSMYQTMIPNLKSIVDKARRAGVLIVYTQDTLPLNHLTESAARICVKMKIFKVADPNLIPELCLEGSWGQDFVDEVKPVPGDAIVKKHRNSAFAGTDLDLMLRSNDIKTLAITGVVTEGCVESTARDGDSYNYFVVLVKDCVGSHNKDLHEASLKVMENRFRSITSDQAAEVWK